MKIVSLLFISLALANCSTPHQAQEEALKKAQHAEAQEKADDAQCRGFGLDPRSDGYAQCRRVLKNGHALDETDDK